MDKRIFTTTHSPGCVFLEVDDRSIKGLQLDFIMGLFEVALC